MSDRIANLFIVGALGALGCAVSEEGNTIPGADNGVAAAESEVMPEVSDALTALGIHALEDHSTSDENMFVELMGEEGETVGRVTTSTEDEGVIADIELHEQWATIRYDGITASISGPDGEYTIGLDQLGEDASSTDLVALFPEPVQSLVLVLEEVSHALHDEGSRPKWVIGRGAECRRELGHTRKTGNTCSVWGHSGRECLCQWSVKYNVHHRSWFGFDVWRCDDYWFATDDSSTACAPTWFEFCHYACAWGW